MSQEERDRGEPSPARRLMHRWFVEYNPLYLVSAMLVLVGMTALSRAAASQGLDEQEIGFVPLIAEVYGFALIGGAALLYRIGQRRPATMLALLSVLYQSDLTLLTERQVHLGAKGPVVAALWLALFVVKMLALARAVRVRLPRSFVALASAGAAGLVALPRLIEHATPERSSLLVSTWLFGLGAAFLWTRRDVASEAKLDAWQTTVLARAQRATWAIWGAALGLHVWLWCSEGCGRLTLLIPAAALLATRWMSWELTVWAAATVTIAGVSVVAPDLVWVTSAMAAVVLALRAWSHRTNEETLAGSPPPRHVYRQGMAVEAGAPEVEVSATIDASARARLLGGAALALWLAAWTLDFAGGPLPAHAWVLDMTLAVVAVGLVLGTRRSSALAAPSLPYVHLGMTLRWWTFLSAGAWGAVSVGLGFAVLLGSLAVGFRLRDREGDAGGPGPLV